MSMEMVSLIGVNIQSRRQQFFQQDFTITICKNAAICCQASSCFHSSATNQPTAIDKQLKGSVKEPNMFH